MSLMGGYLSRDFHDFYILYSHIMVIVFCVQIVFNIIKWKKYKKFLINK